MDLDVTDNATAATHRAVGHHGFQQPHSEFRIYQHLKHHELGTLVELGIKFFLYQRGQISVPFDSLRSSEEGGNDEHHEVTSSLPEGLMDLKQRLKLLVISGAPTRPASVPLPNKLLTIDGDLA